MIIGALKKTGLYDDSVIIFTSDHGDMGASHRLAHKGVLYREACHVPLIVTGGNAGTCDALVSNGLDIVPTILDYAGITKPDYLTGASLRPVVDGTGCFDRKNLIVECAYGKSVQTQEHKLVRYDTGRNNMQFYDLRTNDGEMYNQLEHIIYEDAVNELKRAFQTHNTCMAMSTDKLY
jgi:choline-sulfatase